MRVLVACEESGIVRDAFSARGHDAWSCDLLPTDKPGNHIQCNVLEILGNGWDLMIAHPPCTYLTNAGVRHLHDHCTSKNGNRAKIFGKARWKEMELAAEFFNALRDAPVPKICIENPVPHGYARALIGPYNQLIQPWQFGHKETKATCFWLKNLPLLVETNNVGKPRTAEERKAYGTTHWMSPGPDRAKMRSRTKIGIADAFARQWGLTDPTTV